MVGQVQLVGQVGNATGMFMATMQQHDGAA